MKDSNRIVFNTFVKYTELLCNLVIGVFVLRFVLQALGSEDYGIYTVTAGVIAMLGVLSSSMSSTSMRFMAHSLGKASMETSKRTFNTSLAIHILLGLVLVILLEVGGVLMFNYFLNIPSEKIHIAKIVYQFMVLNSFITVLTVPYDAIINSHENLLFLSSTTVLHNILKLLLAVFLLTLEGEKLVVYGGLTALISIIIMFIRILYCRYRYAESRIDFKNSYDKNMAKSMFAFTGWELFSSLSAMFTIQLRGIFINKFFGVRLNAGEGIAKNINAQANMVSIGITNAITPQMNKSEGSGDRQRLIRLTNIGVKYTSFLFGLVAIPLLLEIPFILKVWLKEVPEFAAVFCQLCIIIQFISKLTWQIGNAIRAVGNIKYYRITSGVLSFISIVVAYLIFLLGGGPLSIFYVEILLCIISGGVTLGFGKKIVGIIPLQFIRETTLPIIIPLAISIAVSLFIQSNLSQGWLRFFVVSGIAIAVFAFMFWLLLKKDEREQLMGLFKNMLSNINIWKK